MSVNRINLIKTVWVGYSCSLKEAKDLVCDIISKVEDCPTDYDTYKRVMLILHISKWFLKEAQAEMQEKFIYETAEIMAVKQAVALFDEIKYEDNQRRFKS